MITICIVTATLNARDDLLKLAHSLLAQTDTDFTWIIADGGSDDGTIESINALEMSQVKIISRPDSGIYDALNSALCICEEDYYVVAGSDDLFVPSAVSEFKALMRDGRGDLGVFAVMQGGRKVFPSGKPWARGHKALISEHSVGTVIRRGLHEKLGLYDQKFAIAADHDFIIKCFVNKAIVMRDDKIVGVNGTMGVSSTDKSRAITESFCVQVRYFNYWAQLFLMIYRLILFRTIIQ